MRFLTKLGVLVILVSANVACSSSSDVGDSSLDVSTIDELHSIETVAEETKDSDVEQPDQTDAVEDLPETTESTESEPIGTDGLVTYDESIPDGSHHAYYIYYDDIKSMSSDSDIVFAGRVTNYIESILTYLAPETESIGGLVDVYDGIVFTVDELLYGELPEDTREVIVLTLAVVTDKEGTPMVRISESPVEVIKEGIEQRNLKGGPTYLVFALREGDPSRPYYNADPNYYAFNTPGSVVEVLGDGNLGIGAERPLSSAKTTELEDTERVNVFTLADVRASIKVTEEDGDVPGATQDNVPGDLVPADSTPQASSTE